MATAAEIDEAKRSLALILLGASRFAHYPPGDDNAAFKASAEAFRAAVTERDATAFGNSVKVLSLFDDPAGPLELLKQIEKFLEQNSFSDIMLYYCGHGDVLHDQTYYLCLNSTEPEHQSLTALSPKELKRVMDKFLRGRRIYLVVDCCYAGEVSSAYMQQGGAQPLMKQLRETFHSGTSIACAALAKREEPLTMFTGTLLDALREGVDGAEQWLSLREVVEETRIRISNRYGSDGVPPEIVTHGQSYGDVANVGLFANRGWSGDPNLRSAIDAALNNLENPLPKLRNAAAAHIGELAKFADSVPQALRQKVLERLAAFELDDSISVRAAAKNAIQVWSAEIGLAVKSSSEPADFVGQYVEPASAAKANSNAAGLASANVLPFPPNGPLRGAAQVDGPTLVEAAPVLSPPVAAIVHQVENLEGAEHDETARLTNMAGQQLHSNAGNSDGSLTPNSASNSKPQLRNRYSLATGLAVVLAICILIGIGIWEVGHAPSPVLRTDEIPPNGSHPGKTVPPLAGQTDQSEAVNSAPVQTLPTSTETVPAAPPAPSSAIARRPLSAEEHFQKGLEGYNRGDYTEALRWYREAADEGNADAQNSLGAFYQDGRGGLAKDDREAARLYNLAADQENAGAQNNLGHFYQDGRGGLAKNLWEATRLYKLAADQGNAGAQNNLGNFYRDGTAGLPEDDREAARLYRLAADQGYAPAQSNLGFLYESGDGGVGRDLTEAARLYKLAADQGDANGQVGLGFSYANGHGGLAKDDREVARLYKLAADQGNAEAQFQLGAFSAEGRGGRAKDNYEALRLIKLAADQGFASAVSVLFFHESSNKGNSKSMTMTESTRLSGGDGGTAYSS
jgi:TPR repeat protein